MKSKCAHWCDDCHELLTLNEAIRLAMLGILVGAVCMGGWIIFN